jgi:hypothetical protein
MAAAAGGEAAELSHVKQQVAAAHAWLRTCVAWSPAALVAAWFAAAFATWPFLLTVCRGNGASDGCAYPEPYTVQAAELCYVFGCLIVTAQAVLLLSISAQLPTPDVVSTSTGTPTFAAAPTLHSAAASFRSHPHGLGHGLKPPRHPSGADNIIGAQQPVDTGFERKVRARSAHSHGARSLPPPPEDVEGISMSMLAAASEAGTVTGIPSAPTGYDLTALTSVHSINASINNNRGPAGYDPPSLHQ